jgi:hypothetical protein
MAVTNALVPIQSFLPSPISLDDIGVSLYHSPDRSWEKARFSVYRPDWVNDIYDPDGGEVGRLEIGQLIDIYI